MQGTWLEFWQIAREIILILRVYYLIHLYFMSDKLHFQIVVVQLVYYIEKFCAKSCQGNSVTLKCRAKINEWFLSDNIMKDIGPTLNALWAATSWNLTWCLALQ